MSQVAPIGERGGPCKRYCTHAACEQLRRIHDARCSVCNCGIGFNARYVESEEGEFNTVYAHAACVESKRLEPTSSTQPKEHIMESQNGSKPAKDMSHLAVVSSMPVAGGLVPRTMDEAMSMAKLLAESDLLPAHLRRKPADVLVTMLKGIELGLKPMAAFSEIYLVNGRPGCSAALKRALVEVSPECELAHFLESTATKATYETKKRGRPATRKSYTIEDAAKAGLTGNDVWKKHPAAMLRARASGAECDAEWQHVIQGMKTLDELREIEGNVVEVKPNRPNLESGSAPVAPTPPQVVKSTPPPAPPKPPSAVPDEPVDDDFEKATAALTEPEPVKEESKPDGGMTDFEKLHALLTEATEPEHLAVLNPKIKAHPNPDEMKTLKQLYIRRSTEMVNARKAAAK